MTLRERIMGVLRESQQPIPTSDLAVLCAPRLSFSRQRVWVVLRHLLGAGIVRKTTERVSGERGAHRIVRWALTESNLRR